MPREEGRQERADFPARLHTEGKGTSYAETDRALTAMKKHPGLAFLGEVSSVPLQQALRHQHTAFAAFFARRARYPRFKSRRGRQCAHACGADVRHSGSSRVQSAVKQEPGPRGPETPSFRAGSSQVISSDLRSLATIGRGKAPGRRDAPGGHDEQRSA